MERSEVVSGILVLPIHAVQFDEENILLATINHDSINEILVHT
jgi:hypothetical protein